MSVDPTLLMGVAGALGSLGTAIYLNRRRIASLETWAWGQERDEHDDGVSGKARSLNGKIDHIEEKIDEQHADVRGEVQENRRYFRVSLENLADELDEQLPQVDLDVDDVEPRWADGGRPREDADD